MSSKRRLPETKRKYPIAILEEYATKKKELIPKINNVSEEGYNIAGENLSTLPFMDSLTLAAYLQTPLSLLNAFLAKDNSMYGYYQFYIDKETKERVEYSEGLKLRKINAPISGLKFWQRKLANVFATYFPVNPCNHGFLKNKSIITAAIEVKDGETLIHFDYSNFFPSHTSLYIMHKLEELFEAHWPCISPKERVTLSYIIARICCKGAELPQGSPASPILTCVLNADLDERLSAIASVYGLRYVRYGDDLCFAGVIDRKDLTILIDKIDAASHPFVINYKKLRIMTDHAYHVFKGVRIKCSPKKFFPSSFAQKLKKLTAKELSINENDCKVDVSKGRITVIPLMQTEWALDDLTHALAVLSERINSLYSTSMNTHFKIRPVFYYVQGVKHALGLNMNKQKITISHKRYEDMRLLAMLMGIQRAYGVCKAELEERKKSAKYEANVEYMQMRLENAAAALHAPETQRHKYRDLLKYPLRWDKFDGSCKWIGSVHPDKEVKLRAIENKFFVKYLNILSKETLGIELTPPAPKPKRRKTKVKGGALHA